MNEGKQNCVRKSVWLWQGWASVGYYRHQIRLKACNQKAGLFIVKCLEHFGITYISKEGIPSSLPASQSATVSLLMAKTLDFLTRDPKKEEEVGTNTSDLSL